MLWNRKYVHFLGFALEAVPEERRRLGALCVLAALIHGCGFWLLHISSPPVRTLPESPGHVMLFTPQLSEPQDQVGRSLWYELNDPSRLIRIRPDWLPTTELPVQILQNPETSRAEVMLPPGDDLRFLPDRLAPLPKRALDSLNPPQQVFHYDPSTGPPIASQTVSYWSDGLQNRRAGANWELPSVTADLLDQTQVTILRIAVDAQGQVEHVLVESSCGKSEVDLLAAESARTLRFPPSSDAPLQWGRVSIFWNFTAPPPEAKVPPANPK